MFSLQRARSASALAGDVGGAPAPVKDGQLPTICVTRRSPRPLSERRNMRYQTLDSDHRIVNCTSFGRRLRRFLRQHEQKILLPRDCSWRSAGAWILADALVHWSKQHLGISALRAPDGLLKHVVASEPRAGAFIDADGVAGQIELMTKMAVIKRAPNLVLATFSADDARAAGLPYQEDVALEMAMRLLHQFGSYRPELLSATGHEAFAAPAKRGVPRPSQAP